MPSPTESRGLPLANAWQDWFSIGLRTWANVTSPEFESELVKKVLGQQADLPQHGATTCTRDLLQHRRQDVTVLTWRGSVVWLRDFESVAQRNPCPHGRAHSFSREDWKARRSAIQETVVQPLKTAMCSIRDLNNVHDWLRTIWRSCTLPLNAKPLGGP